MDLTVLVEKIDEERFRAATAQPITLETEGRTREEAVSKLQDLARKRLAAGEILQVEVPEIAPPHPWHPFAGLWKDHPEYERFRKNVAQHKRQVDGRERHE